MSITVEEIFLRACSLNDSMTDAGAIDANTTADYRGRTLALTNMCQMELMKVADNYSKYEIARSPIISLLGDGNLFDVKEYKGFTDDEYTANNDEVGSVQAYYFESDATSGTVYIEDYTTQWNILDTVTLSNTGLGFMAYSGKVTKTTGATRSRIRFSGSFFYRYRNVGLYSYSFDGDVPIYRQWIPYDLPVDLKMIKDVNVTYYDGLYTRDPMYKIEWDGNRQTMFVNYRFRGTMRIVYIPYPTQVTAFTDLLEVDDMTAQCIAYYLAMNFVATEQNTELTNLFRQQYESLKFDISKKQPETETTMVDFYEGTNANYYDNWGGYNGFSCNGSTR